jgi:hypothetical protein
MESGLENKEKKNRKQKRYSDNLKPKLQEKRNIQMKTRKGRRRSDSSH